MRIKLFDRPSNLFKTQVWFILCYWAIIIVFFELARLFFLLNIWNESRQLGTGLFIQILWHGLIMDISMATYIIIPVIFFCLLSVYILFFRKALIYQVYTGIVLFIIVFLLFVDVGMYKAWGFRLDATPLKYLKNPKEAYASIAHLPLLAIAIAIILLYAVLLWLNNRFLLKATRKIIYTWPRPLSILVLLLLTGLCIIPMRGGLQLSPINQSTVYFSSNNFVNQAALNPIWNLMYSLNHAVDETTNPYNAYPLPVARAITDPLFRAGKTSTYFIDLERVPAPNVIIIIWEGFTAKVIDAKKEGRFITPNYNILKTQGVYFPGLYATGDRTDKGLAGILSGQPAHPLNSIVKIPLKAARLPMLSKVFRNRDYNTSFFYGGETEFANMKAYLVQGQFQQFISINDFKKEDQNSKWGAHDEVVMNRMFRELVKTPQPFFSTWLTLSSHEPFEVPAKTVIKGKDEVSLYLNSLHYTDSVVNTFIQKLKATPVWDNTLVVIVPDHGTRMPATGFKGDDFKIGLLFLGGALSRQGLSVDRLGSQTDLAATLTAQLGLDPHSFTWSRNLMDTTAQQWAFFSFNNGFGYAQPKGVMIFDNTGNRLMQSRGVTGDAEIKKGKALQQLIYQDYLDK